MTGKQLKNAILQLAIQGKLVPQDANDEPASVLLAKIRKEKEQLVKAGKLKKKELETTPITDEEKPFEIPESWEWVHFEDIAQGLTGKTPERGNQEYWSSAKYPWVSISDMTDYGYVKFSKEAISEKATKVMRDISTKGSLLMSFKLTVGRTSILDIDAYHNEAIITVRPFFDKSNNLRDFLFRFLPLITEDGDTKDAIKGRTLNAKSIASLLIPLPPLSEQKRIVAKIEELMPLVEEYGVAQEKLNRLNAALPEALKKSILQQAIQGKLVPQDANDEPASVLLTKIRKEKEQLVKAGKLKKKDLETTPITDEEKPFEIPESWEWCRLGEIGSWGSGATPAKGKPEYYTNGTIPWLRTGELNNGYVFDSEIKVTQTALDNCSLRMCKKGDVLIAMYGATIGKVAIAGIELTTNQACCACTPILIFNEYLMLYLMASKQAFIELGEGGAQPNISREKIVVFPFALPPLSEQRRIVARVEELLSMVEGMK